jgi:hypothetical protein
MPWNAYPALIATVLSVICLSYLAYRKHNGSNPRPLSELAAESNRALTYFRLVLWSCGSLFAISMYTYVIPNLKFSTLQTIAWSLTYFPELALAALPAAGKTFKAHQVAATLMGVGMFSSAVIFMLGTNDNVQTFEIMLVVVMTICTAGTILDKKRYLFYELLFIFSAHISILIAISII